MKNKKLMQLLSIFAIFLFGCSALSGGNNNSSSIEVDDFFTDVLPAENDDNQSDATTIMVDDFSSLSSGWPNSEDEYSSSYYIDEEYVISIHLEDYISWVYMSDTYSNMIIEVDAAFTGGGDDNSFGVICRHQDEDNFYVFVISADGYMGIGKTLDGGEITIMGTENLESSTAINMGFETNHIKASCVGENLTMWVNGVLVAEVQDSSISSGSYGLFVGTFSAPETTISFDNLDVSTP